MTTTAPAPLTTRERIEGWITLILILVVVGGVIAILIFWGDDDTSGDGSTRTFAECVTSKEASNPGWRIEECDPDYPY